ncbi:MULTISPECIES: hypothetical protein [Streptomyces]|jgi:hypothetical protein|uniref:hypothetical protein n=1 Tax=Streptomyces TaxID=1883 RepID=UPI000F737E18|nr:hypothetical protein [Streptomyces sp. WAC05292]RSS80186.1 hypothetical protein EF903_30485 [Streptomyces sp. WAC05292]
MQFVQIIDFETERIEDVRKLLHDYDERARAEGRQTGPVSRMLLKDRANPNRHLAVVGFDSYETAMANSRAPETDAFASHLAQLLNRPPVYIDCDVEEQDGSRG